MAVVIAIDAPACWIAHRLWRTLPLASVSIMAALLAFQALAFLRQSRRLRMWLSLAAALILQVDWVPVARTTFEALHFDVQAKLMNTLTGAAPAEVSVSPKLADPKDKFLMEEYHTAISEIQKRLDGEQLLFGLKFTLIGAIMFTLFGFMRREVSASEKDSGAKSGWVPVDSLKQSPIAAAFSWASVVVAAIIDARIQFNAAFIATLGTWVQQIERTILSPDQELGWEHFLAMHGLLSKASYPFVRMSWGLVTWLLFAVTLFVLVDAPDHPVDTERKQKTREINRAFSLFAFGAFALSSLGFRPGSGDVIVHSIVWAVLGGACSWSFANTPTTGPPTAPPVESPPPEPAPL